MKKQFKEQGINFIISVDFTQSTMERRPGASPQHTIVCNCLDGWNYYDKQTATTDFLAATVQDMETAARDAAKKRNNIPEEEQILLNLGFEK